MTVTTDFHGYMLFCFENGKMTKTPVKNYETKLNRKKLAKAFSAASPLVKLIFLEEDIELVAVSTVGKALAFNTSAVPVKTTRDSQGVAVMTLKSGAFKDVLTPEQFGAEDLKYYKTKISRLWAVLSKSPRPACDKNAADTLCRIFKIYKPTKHMVL